MSDAPSPGDQSSDEHVPTLKTHFRLQYEPAQEAHVLLYPEGMVKLSPSAAEILKRIDGTRSIGTIIADLKATFPGAELDDDVRAFINQAVANGWITR